MDSAQSPAGEPGQTESSSAPEEPRGPFFLTLGPVAAPVAVREPKLSGLQRMRFFFTRRHEQGRERCWLHFGHFDTVAEACKWLDALHPVYPAAVIRSALDDSEGSVPSITDSQDSVKDGDTVRGAAEPHVC
jgi:hypothetical protein